MDTKHQRKRAAQIQKTWAALAFRDARYNEMQAHRDRTMGNITLAKLHEREARVDRTWGNKRLRWARKY